MFDILSKAKPAALHKLLSKLPPDEAAIVLTQLPNTLAIQVLAFYPGDAQTELGSAMVDARWAEPAKVELVESKIRAMLQQAKQNLTAKSAGGAETPAEKLRTFPAKPTPKPALKPANPYQAAAETPQKVIPKAPPPPENTTNPTTGKPTLAARAKELAKTMLRPPVSAKRSAEKAEKHIHVNEPPKPWVPRQATTSPINGPAIPGTPPPVAGDPFASPLAKAGLLDLIGRAQEKLLPKDAARAEAPPGFKLDKNGRPEPLEGLLAPGSVELTKTPRVIGYGAPKQNKPAAGKNGDGAGDGAPRRMDGKAILAAILREAGPEIRGTVRHDDPSLFKQLRERMFYFDDLALTDDNALARVFTAAPTDASALALKFAAPKLRDRVLRAVSPGRARALAEHTGARAGLDEVEQAQKTVLDVALQLQSAGRILIDPRDPDLAGK